MTRHLETTIETYPIAGVFTISRGSRTEAEVVVCTISERGATGRGECVPYKRYGETLESVERRSWRSAISWPTAAAATIWSSG